MPQPHSRNRLTPDDLARRLAGQIASKKPPKPRYRLRDSVLVGRMIAVAAALIPAGVLVAAVLVAFEWWTDGSTADEVLATQIVASGPGVSSTTLPDDPDLSETHVVDSVVLGSGSGVMIAGFLPQLPSPTTTSPAVKASETSLPSTSDPSTGPTTTTSPLPTTTSVPSTDSTVGSTSTSRAGTTTTIPVSTTTFPETTTTIPPTTTTPVATTATCPGNSGGNGNAPCGP